MKFLESLMHWPPLHLKRIRHPPSGHCRKLGRTNHPKNIVITHSFRKSSLLVAFILVFIV
ncbi:hypothetical protein ACFFQF_21540 [Haladaptatus pallidirubidus]